VEIRARMYEHEDGRWTAWSERFAGTVTAASRSECVAALRAGLEATDPVDLVIEVVPRLAGVAEAADLMGWDKRRVATYADRGSFPAPVQSLRSGRVWLRSDIEAFAEAWRARLAERAVHRARRPARTSADAEQPQPTARYTSPADQPKRQETEGGHRWA
jgi:hypothetical protein